MKFIISILLTALLSAALCLYLPWWVIALAALLVATVIPQRPLLSFLTGFIALFLAWGGLAWYISSANHQVLADRMSLLILKAQSPMALVLLTAVIGAVVAGLGALTGSLIRPAKRTQIH